MTSLKENMSRVLDILESLCYYKNVEKNKMQTGYRKKAYDAVLEVF